MDDAATREVALAAHLKFKKYSGGYLTLTADELATLPADKFVVDIRTLDEIAVSRIPGSITAAEFFEAARLVCAVVPPVVVVCTVGFRAALWARDMRERYSGPVYISRGILLYALDGKEVVREEDGGTGREGASSPAWVSVKELHVFDRSYALVPAGWAAKYYSAPKAAWHAARYAPMLLRASRGAAE
jgi:rhodanese-related sulfurtransferase